MDFALFVPIAMVIGVVAIIKIVTDSRLRRRLAETNASEDLIRAMLTADEQSRSLSALKWGIVLTVLGVAFGLISALHLDVDDPATFGLLIGSAGLSMLGFHFVAARKH